MGRTAKKVDKTCALYVPIKHIYSPEFDTNGHEIISYDESKDPNAYRVQKQQVAIGLEPEIQIFYDNLKYSNVYSVQAQLKMFKKYNYAKYRAEQLRQKLVSIPLSDITEHDLNRWLTYTQIATDSRNRLMQNNMKLLVFCVNRAITKREYSDLDNDHILSESTNKMFSVLDGYDFRLNFQFSTYLYRSIMNFINLLYRRKANDNMFCHAGDTDYTLINDKHQDNYDFTENFRIIKQAINKLQDREKYILYNRFGIGVEKKTLKDLAAELQITRERVRQIEMMALNRIRVELSLINKDMQQELGPLIAMYLTK